MELLSALNDPAVWQEYLDYKISGGHLHQDRLKDLTDYIETEAYRPVVQRILEGGSFAPPTRSEISKMHSAKKRIVYTYTHEENWVLKLLTFLLTRQYDSLFAGNLYSFRRFRGVRDAVVRLTREPRIKEMWSYKTDVSNYFNSVPVERLLPLLRQVLQRHPDTCRFLESLLTEPLVNDKGTLVPEQKGIMAGTPISTFLANLYLSHMDHYFQDAGVLYARYSDDIIVFALTEETLEKHVSAIHTMLAEAGLTVNPAKDQRSAPGQMWTFLGISYQDGVVDVSPVSVEKLKAKMRRKARALSRWQSRKGVEGIQAAKAFVRTFNRKLFENPVEHELTWTRWYFPLINTAESLKIIDEYSQSCIRFLATGKRTKAAYNFRYEDMKKLGYRNLVSAYYNPPQALGGSEYG